METIPNKIDRAEDRANYHVAVFAASSDANKYSVANSRVSGKIIASHGFSLVNGGYATGGMGSASEGFDEIASSHGLDDNEIKKRKLGIIFSDKAVGEGLKNERKVNPNTEFIEKHDFVKRSDGIIENSDADIAVEGGIGTGIEGMSSAMNEWFKEKLKDREGNPLNREKPIIIIDRNNSIPSSIKVFEKNSQGTINTLGKNIFVLSGHMVHIASEDKNTVADANLENDPEMKEKLEMILEYFFLKKIKEEDLLPEEKVELERLQSLVDQDSPERIMPTLKDFMKSGQHFVNVVDTRKQFEDDGSGI